MHFCGAGAIVPAIWTISGDACKKGFGCCEEATERMKDEEMEEGSHAEPLSTRREEL